MIKINMKRIFTTLVVLLPLLYQYKSPISAISFGEFILIPFMIYFLLKNISTNVRYKDFKGLYTYLFLVLVFNTFASFQSYYDYKESITVIARIFFYAILVYISYNNFDFEYGIKILIYTTTFCCIYIMLQVVAHYTIDVYLPTIINPDWVFAAEESGNRLDYEKYYRWTYRPSSLFLEPGYFVSFSAPALLALLHFKKINNKNFLVSLIITVGLVLSTASSAIVVLALAWGFLILKNLFKEDGKVNKNILIMIIAIIVFFVILLLSPISTTLIKRTMTGGSFNNRITRTIILFQNTDFVQKITGVGLNNIANWCEEDGISTEYDEKDLNFVSSYIGTLLLSGVVVFVFYNRFFIKMFCENKQLLIRLMILVFLFFNLIGNIIFSYKFAFYTILIFCAQKYYKTVDGGTNATN